MPCGSRAEIQAICDNVLQMEPFNNKMPAKAGQLVRMEQGSARANPKVLGHQDGAGVTAGR
eukprot:675177-Pyramimonas_sp.AAC.1